MPPKKEKDKKPGKKGKTPAPALKFEQPDPVRVSGLSTSHYTGVVDWAKAKANGIQFAIIKAKHGLNTANFFKENYRGAKDAGVLVGAYAWLVHPAIASAGGQARTFADFLRDYPVDLPPFVDFEWNPGPKKDNPDSGDLWGFVIPFETAYGKKPGVYTAPGYWSEYGATNALWANYPLWMAQYNKGLSDPMPPWQKYDVLQWSVLGEGIKYGIPITGERACELNYWRGTRAELLAFCGLPPENI
jgi:lysozyme